MSQKSLWYTRCPVPTAFSLAVRNGWLDSEFEKDGIAVSSLRQSGDSSIRESHFNHTQADSFRHGGNIPPIWTRSRGNDLKLIGLSWTEVPYRILALPGSGIRTAADLKGRRLSLSRRVNDQIDFSRATHLHTYEQALGHAGLTLKDVELVDLTVERTYLEQAGDSSHDGSLFNAVQARAFQREDLFALISGKVDAIASNGPRTLENEALLGAHVVFDSKTISDPLGRTNNLHPAALTVSGALLERRPDLVARVLARVLQAADWAKHHASDTVRVVAAEQGTAEEFIDRAYEGRLAQQLDVDLSDVRVEGLRKQKDFLLRHGFIAADFDFDAWIARGPLEGAKRLLAGKATSSSASLAEAGAR